MRKCPGVSTSMPSSSKAFVLGRRYPSYVGLRWPEPLPKCLPLASIILRNSQGEIVATFLKVKAYFKSIIEVIQI